MTNKTQLQIQIDILKAVKAGRIAGTNESPYVCDNVNEVGDDNDAIEAIHADIAEFIDHKFGVEDYLGIDHLEYAGDQDAPMNLTDKAKEFRMNMIDTLINRYEDALAAA